MRIVCVLRSGGDFRAEHVARLHRQVSAHMPGMPFLCLTDRPRELWDLGIDALALAFDWPGWWSKMEVFANDVRGDVLFLDLDVTVIGDLSSLAAVPGPALMRDVYRPGGLQSAVMVLPESCRPRIWTAWWRDPANWMARYVRGGDQAFLERFWLREARRLQDAVPGQIVSYKADVLRLGAVPEGARIVVHHGRPRPWDVEAAEDLGRVAA